MVATPLRIEDRFDGASNFLSWKERVTLSLKARVTLSLNEYDLWELVDKAVNPPIDPINLYAHNKKEIKVERVLLDSLKDHLIPHLNKKMMTKEMFYALVSYITLRS